MTKNKNTIVEFIKAKKTVCIIIGAVIILAIIAAAVFGGGNGKGADGSDQSQSSQKEYVPQYEGFDLNEIIAVKLPANYGEPEDTKYADNPAEGVTQKLWLSSGEENAAIMMRVFSYKGDLIEGSEEIDIKKIMKADTTEKRELNGDTFYIVKEGSEQSAGDVYTITAYLEHGDYIIAMNMENEMGPLSKEQIKEFDEILKSIRFKRS